MLLTASGNYNPGYMLRAASEVRQRCSNHPHRRATRLCARCRIGLCGDCARERAGDELCARCRVEVAERYRIEHPTATERVRRFGVSIRSMFIAVGFVCLLIVPGFFIMRGMLDRPLSPEELARFKYAMSGTFETPEGVNVLSTVLGAQLVSASSEQPGFEARHIINEYVGPGFPGWRSAGASFPQEFVFETHQPTFIAKLYVVQQPGEPPETSAREIEVLVSEQSSDGPWNSVGTFTLEQTEEPQRFTFPEADARWVMLRVLSNYGGPYTSLGEFNALIPPREPFGPQLAGTPAPSTEP